MAEPMIPRKSKKALIELNKYPASFEPVSYTHLTLPTTAEV